MQHSNANPNLGNDQQLPIWYFAFSQQRYKSLASSLLSQYARQHKFKHIINPIQGQLEALVNHECIIQISQNFVLYQWEPKKSNISVIFIGEKQQFIGEEGTILNDYLQIGRCKHYQPKSNNDKVAYEQFRRLMYPNLIFFYGPNHKHIQVLSSTMAFQTLYKYVDKLPSTANQIVSNYRKSVNYVFNWLFTNPTQIQILNSRFTIRIIHFKYQREYFPNDEKYFDEEYAVINYLSGKEYFRSIDGNITFLDMVGQIGEFLCPKLIYINANTQEGKQYAKNYAKDRHTQLYSIFDVQSINKRKNVILAASLQDKVRRLNSIILSNLTVKEVTLIYFPWHVSEVRLFEHVTRKFNWFVDLDAEESYNYTSQYTSNIYFLQTQRRIHPNLQFPLTNQIQHSQRYWVVAGPQGVGKTTVSKYLETQYQLSYIEFQPYLTGLKEKLLTPQDGQQLPLRKIISHFKELLSKNIDKQLIIDGFSYSNNELKQWVKQIGLPTVINLKSDQGNIIKRQRRKAQADLAAQVTEEQSQKVKELIEKQSQWVQKLNQLCPDAIIYTVDFNHSLILAEKLLQSIFQPRVFLTQSNPTLLYQNIAIRHNFCLINLALYSFQQAKRIAKSSGKRDVIIANYRQVQDKLVSEDLYWIEKNIGKIRYLAIWGGQQKTYQDEYIPLIRPVEQKKKKPIAEGEQGQQPPAQQQPPAEQQGEVKKKKLDIYAYQWTQPLCHKNLSQWYFKLKKNIQEYESQPKQAYQQFKQKLQKINSNPNISIYEILKPEQQ